MMKISANCKINIGLRVVRRRDDGYHELQTVMFPVRGLCDTVGIERTGASGAIFEGAGITVDCPPEDNLCVKAFDLMRRRYGIDGVRIMLDKRIPFGAGLGGGSADATAVVVGIDRLFGLALSEEELIAAAAELGSDTAFFVRNTPQYCTGRGEVMSPIDLNLKGRWLAVVKPDESVSTREAYAGVVPQQPARDLCRDLQLPVEQWQEVIVNDFEPHIFVAHPLIADLKRRLLDAGAAYASMSGSGSALFGLFAERPQLDLPHGTFVHTERISMQMNRGLDISQRL